ncbi:MAG TPA: CocE/NonD family hydrolase [Mycobacteriales bacterium]|nr:CocE/NonD family hydrolase [Mycobacteriales bacterium]
MHTFTGFIPVRDGVGLAFDAWLPDGASADSPVPAVVTRTPYNRGRYHSLDGSPWPRVVDAGYAHVGVDVRGRGDSPGVFIPFAHDGYDGYDVVEWVAAQDWCTGNVGGIGASYDALTQWWAMRHQPPSLKCAIPIAVSAQSYGDGNSLAFGGGVPMPYWIWWFAFLQHGAQRGVVELYWDDVLSHPIADVAVAAGLDESFQRHWAAYLDGRLGYGVPDCSIDPATVQIPTLVQNGLWDDPQTFQWWEQLVAASPAKHRLLAGVWDHAGNAAPQPVLGGIDVAGGTLDPVPIWIDFLDQHLKDVAPDVTPPVVQIARSGANTWETHDAWPLHSLPVTHSFGPDAWKHDPADPVKQGGGNDLSSANAPLSASALDTRADVVSFDLPVASGDEDYSGRPTAMLTIAQEHPGSVVCWLSDIGPDGDGMRIGFWPSAHAHPGGGTQTLDIGLPHVHHRLLPGHRWRLSVTSSYVPVYAHGLESQEIQLVSGSITLPREQ